jgi:hypothetical protein
MRKIEKYSFFKHSINMLRKIARIAANIDTKLSVRTAEWRWFVPYVHPPLYDNSEVMKQCEKEILATSDELAISKDVLDQFMKSEYNNHMFHQKLEIVDGVVTNHKGAHKSIKIACEAFTGLVTTLQLTWLTGDEHIGFSVFNIGICGTILGAIWRYVDFWWGIEYDYFNDRKSAIKSMRIKDTVNKRFRITEQ